MRKVLNDIPHFLALMRVDKPIGSLLLLWPTLWALWICFDSKPPVAYVWLFTCGVLVMRSAGCVINDYADRDIDGSVERTKMRPLASGALKPGQALGLFLVLGLIASLILFMLPTRVWPWSIPAACLTVSYPFMKRFIQAPQLVLGLAFSFAIPMVYVTADHAFDSVFWMLFFANVVWVFMFDTLYAMSDREEDLKIGVKSSAILLGHWDVAIMVVLMLIFVVFWVALKLALNLSPAFYFALLSVCGFFAWQIYLIKDRQSVLCFQAFLNNAWVGAVLWFGLVTSF